MASPSAAAATWTACRRLPLIIRPPRRSVKAAVLAHTRALSSTSSTWTRPRPLTGVGDRVTITPPPPRCELRSAPMRPTVSARLDLVIPIPPRSHSRSLPPRASGSTSCSTPSRRRPVALREVDGRARRPRPCARGRSRRLAVRTGDGDRPRRPPPAADDDASSTCARAATRNPTGWPRSRAGSSAASPTPTTILGAVSSWVGRQLVYVSGSSLPTHGAVDTLLGGRGVCRDYAHLVVALLRARDVPARVAAVYAPGLQPMDFHAVAEASSTGPGASSTPRCSRRARRSSASRRAATPPTPRSSP